MQRRTQGIVLLLYFLSSVKGKTLKGNTLGCQETPKELICNITGMNADWLFNEDSWGPNMTSIEVTGARPSLALVKQKGIKDIIWKFSDCIGVRIDDTVGEKLKKLEISSSEATIISNIQSALNAKSSVFKKVSLENVEQFDFNDSKVSELDIRAVGHKSTFKDSSVDHIRNLVLEGTFLFEIENSDFNKVDKLVFNTSGSQSKISDTYFGTVGYEGIVLLEKLIIENTTFDYLSSRAIVTKEDLIIKDSRIKDFYVDSLVVERGKIAFVNVNLRGRNISFSVRDVEGGYLPMASIFPEFSKERVKKALGVSIPLSLIAGILCGGALVYFWLRRRSQSLSPDNLRLLPETKVEPNNAPSQPPPPPTPITQHDSLSEPKDDEDDEIYADYEDVNVGLPAPPSSINLNVVNNNFREFPPANRPSPVGSQAGPPPQPRLGMKPIPPQREAKPAPPQLDKKPVPPPPGTNAPPRPGFSTHPHGLRGNEVSATPVTRPLPGAGKPFVQPEDDDLELYDEVNQGPTTPPPSAPRPPILNKKPSFLHDTANSLPPPSSLPSNRSAGGPASKGPPPAIPGGKPKLQKWPPTLPSKPQLSQAAASNNLEDEENDIYEEVVEVF